MADAPARTDGLVGRAIRIRGLVQGVGFRPTVWRLARDARLVGTVRNDAEGVLIAIAGSLPAIDMFPDRLTQNLPPLARIDTVEIEEWRPDAWPDAFTIIESDHGPPATGIVADAATCADCLADIADPVNRRYRYPFTNCTHCGPRLTIVNAIPYDRATTSMAAFAMCPACTAEYTDPSDRRFHAQPNACPDCGPKVWLEAAPDADTSGDPIEAAARVVRDGEIVAVKGIGGFHLAVDATNEDAVTRLRARKRRHAKPLAVMARDLDMASSIADIDDDQRAALLNKAAPIVLLRAHAGALAEGIAPRQREIGVMLPYSPLHHLLADAIGRPFVLTSGNLSDEPQAIDNGEARARLGDIADAFLMHDRDIVNRIDDSVVRVRRGATYPIRRARGFAPEPLPLPPGFDHCPPVLAMGGELKATFCLLTPSGAVVSQHIGDLENVETNADYHRMLDLYREIFAFTPELIAVDRHPDYFSTQTGIQFADRGSVPIEIVDHHHAHIAAVMAEHGLGRERVVGLALDGLGMGPDGGLWGGEVLVCDYVAAERVAALPAIALIGGARAMREPWRNLFAHLEQAFGWGEIEARWGSLAPIQALAERQIDTLRKMMRHGINAPSASSAGRLFDAVAAALDLFANEVAYEGQAAMALEALATDAVDVAPYPTAILIDGAVTRIDLAPFWEAFLDDLAAGADRRMLAARFHETLAETFAGLAIETARDRGLERAALSGGVFQNTRLTEAVERRIQTAGLQVLTHRHVPANDGGLSLGQAMIATARRMQSTEGSCAISKTDP